MPNEQHLSYDEAMMEAEKAVNLKYWLEALRECQILLTRVSCCDGRAWIEIDVDGPYLSTKVEGAIAVCAHLQFILMFEAGEVLPKAIVKCEDRDQAWRDKPLHHREYDMEITNLDSLWVEIAEAYSGDSEESPEE